MNLKMKGAIVDKYSETFLTMKQRRIVNDSIINDAMIIYYSNIPSQFTS